MCNEWDDKFYGFLKKKREKHFRKSMMIDASTETVMAAWRFRKPRYGQLSVLNYSVGTLGRRRPPIWWSTSNDAPFLANSGLNNAKPIATVTNALRLVAHAKWIIKIASYIMYIKIACCGTSILWPDHLTRSRVTASDQPTKTTGFHWPPFDKTFHLLRLGRKWKCRPENPRQPPGNGLVKTPSPISSSSRDV